MTEEDIKKHLINFGVVEVGAWTFTGLRMHCWDYDEEYGFCCEDEYPDYDQAVKGVLFYANNDYSKIRLED